MNPRAYLILSITYLILGLGVLLLASCVSLREEIDDPLVLRWAEKILNDKEVAE